MQQTRNTVGKFTKIIYQQDTANKSESLKISNNPIKITKILTKITFSNKANTNNNKITNNNPTNNNPTSNNNNLTSNNNPP